jgi:ribokinase
MTPNGHTRPSVAVVGAALIDLISYVPRLPRLGETLHGSDFALGFGGKGANQAVMAAKLGAQVAIVTKLGRDRFGEDTLENFRSYGLDTTHVSFDERAPSGVAPIAVDPNGDNSIVIVTGANGRLGVADVERARPAIAAADVLVCQLEIPTEATLAALELARAESTLTILNPAPAARDLPDALFAHADVLCPNEPEAEAMLGAPIGRGDELAAARALCERGAGAVVLTLGERGCAIVAEGGELHLPTRAVAALDTTGAGDAFVGTLAVGLARGHDLPTAARYANRVATISVQRRGTQTSFPDAAELDEGL